MTRDSGWPALGEWLFLLVLPLAAYYVLHYVPINQKGTLDPYVYTGYIQNAPDLLERFGLTYYSVRFGLILPARVFAVMLGPQAGYFVLRYLLALVGGVPLYFVAKRYLRPGVAVVIYAAFLGSPFVARALLWEHPDATGLPFLTAAICLVLLHEHKAGLWDVLAGCAAAMAIHSNIFTVCPFGIFALAYSGLWILYGKGIALLGRRSLLVAGGILAVTIMGSTYYWLTVGQPDVFTPTLQAVLWLTGGALKRWRLPGVAWTVNLYHIFVPVWLSLGCLCVTRWRTETFARVVMVTVGVLTTLFYFVHQFLLGGDELQLHYYFSYLAPAIFLMLGVLCHHIRDSSKGHALWLGIILVSATTLPWVLQSLEVDFSRVAGFHSFLALAAVSLIVIVAVTHWRLKYSRTASVLSAVLLAWTFDTGFMNFFPSVIQSRLHPNSSELDVYAVTVQFIHAVPKVRDHPGAILFWYDNSHNSALNSVQSTFLWGYSRFSQIAPLDAPGHPYFGDFQKKMLKEPGLRYLGLMGESGQEIKERLDTLTAQQVSFRQLSNREFASGGYRIYFQLLELTGR